MCALFNEMCDVLQLSNVFVQPMVTGIYQTLSDQEVVASHGLERTQSRPSSLATGSTAVEWSLSGEPLCTIVYTLMIKSGLHYVLPSVETQLPLTTGH